MNIACYLHHPGDLSSRSGMYPLAEALGAEVIWYGATWWRLEQRSSRLGQWARKAGVRYYGSQWNSLLPGWDEWRLAWRGPHSQIGISHFLWGEFARPRWPWLFRRGGSKLVVTFHASATRLPEVLGGLRSLRGLDGITLMSKTQEPFFQALGMPSGRMRTILHGVDTAHFQPAPDRVPGNGPLRGFLIGVTERDHAFMAQVLRALPPDVLQLDVATSSAQQANYEGVPHVNILPRLDDRQLLRVYQEADLLVMPMRDCTANNAVLEAMACGTPVLINRIGGVPEYVDASCNHVLEDKDVDRWVAALTELRGRRAALEASRPAVRAAAEKMDWHTVARSYLQFYASL